MGCLPKGFRLPPGIEAAKEPHPESCSANRKSQTQEDTEQERKDFEGCHHCTYEKKLRVGFSPFKPHPEGNQDDKRQDKSDEGKKDH